MTGAAAGEEAEAREAQESPELEGGRAAFGGHGEDPQVLLGTQHRGFCVILFVNAHFEKSNFALEQAALPAGLDKVFHTETAHLRIKLIQVA